PSRTGRWGPFPKVWSALPSLPFRGTRRRTRCSTRSRASHLLEFFGETPELFALRIVEHGGKLRDKGVDLRVGERPRALSLRRARIDRAQQLFIAPAVHLLGDGLRFGKKILRQAAAREPCKIFHS